MKTSPSSYLFGLIFMMAFLFACTNSSTNNNLEKNDQISDTELSKHIIPTTYANVCKVAYAKLFNLNKNPKANIAAIDSAYTSSVGFNAKLVIERFTDVMANSNCNKIEMVFGLYVDPSTDSSGKNFGLLNEQAIEYCTKYKDRVTVFLWPYFNDEPANANKKQKHTTTESKFTIVDPLNLGQLIPPPF